ncbi:MAG TPA: hypothetical protein VLL25_11525 [Acidimicrobiales bacterium]|nr:hypothetical protein [Acidimicrobiales bacterium]
MTAPYLFAVGRSRAELIKADPLAKLALAHLAVADVDRWPFRRAEMFRSRVRTADSRVAWHRGTLSRSGSLDSVLGKKRERL